jgi:hypothetical protein
MSPDHVGIGYSIFGERDHELGEAISADIVGVKTEFCAGLSEYAVQGNQFFVVESVREHGGSLLEGAANRSPLNAMSSTKVAGMLLT